MEVQKRNESLSFVLRSPIDVLGPIGRERRETLSKTCIGRERGKVGGVGRKVELIYKTLGRYPTRSRTLRGYTGTNGFRRKGLEGLMQVKGVNTKKYRVHGTYKPRIVSK